MVIQAQRHHNLEIMVPFESRHAGLSNFQVRDGSAAAGQSGQLGFSNEITLKGVSNFKNDNFQAFDGNIEPINFDIEGPELDFQQNNELNPVGPGDYPSLRDLETSNAFTRSNLNIAENKKEALAQIQKNSGI